MLQKTKPLFFDTEFTGLHQNTSLISLALVADSAEEFYAEFTDYDPSQVSPWIEKNVINNLFLSENTILSKKVHIKGSREAIIEQLSIWFSQFDEQLQIWADVPHYDWVLFCELFGGAFGIPQNIHYMPMDIATLIYTKGIPVDISREELAGYPQLDGLKLHNALYDAYLIKEIYNKLQ